MRTPITTGSERRTFLRRAAAAGVGLSAGPTILMSAARGVAPSNRVAMGLIGCGGRMGGVLGALRQCPEFQPVAVCDVYTPARERLRTGLGLCPEDAHVDFRELLARDDIDAVAIATPDHWHVPQAIAAMEAGKDVYCEKPLSNTIREGRALVRAAERTGRIFQHGTQLHSYSGVLKACEAVRNGILGDLEEVIIGSPPGILTGLHPTMDVPPDLEYDLWLGPAPPAPYTRARVFREQGLPGWYFISDYSKAGWIAGYGVHDLDIAQWALGVERSGPVAIEGEGVYPREGLFDTITTYRIEFTYADGHRIVMTDTGQNRHGVRFVGSEGTVFTRGGVEAEPRSLLDTPIGTDGVHLYRSPGHARNFIDCVLSRAETITPPEIAHRATSTALLGGIACRLQRPLRWDPYSERFEDDDQADRLLQCPMRPPWGV